MLPHDRSPPPLLPSAPPRRYLSPHVNLAARIEAATKMYRLPILMSSTFAIELSPYAQSYLRLLDRVTVRVTLT